ncbi:DNA polymerase III subunit delta' [Vibrio sp. SS-MA-C1-2]|uniref:DNA polymerase III subunit delta' n=1 Tax=Vibrio sp. SS-MA-C1-2 TaxID=2908646 RepID=UPI001F45EE71|nr:DNA polymerase III subunit delta' [Vibrio sp. SS-MA-C1-2]UJF19923.1 DNA polymerase III subunit delta' [Vibrio sp. SS-MA-C1-2]
MSNQVSPVSPYPWQQTLLSQWQQLLQQQRLHHAILLSGVEGMGQKVLLSYLAKTLLCPHSTVEPCQQCHSCQLFDANNHPDFHLIESENSVKQIAVDTIRKSNELARKTSQLGGARVILLSQAEQLGEAAANALLKTLEEPPEQCYFLLSCHHLDRLLPTIVSRCNRWHLPQPDEVEIKNWVEANRNASVSLQLLRLNRGAPLATLSFLEQGKESEHQQVVELFSQYLINNGQGWQLLTSVLAKFYPDSLQWLSYLLLDVTKWQQGVNQGLVHCDMTEALVQITMKFSSIDILNQIRTLNQLQRTLVTNSGLNSELLIGEWLLGITGEQ